jgi:hypothetical protein
MLHHGTAGTGKRKQMLNLLLEYKSLTSPSTKYSSRVQTRNVNLFIRLMQLFNNYMLWVLIRVNCGADQHLQFLIRVWNNM